MSILGILASGISGHLTPTSPVAGYSAWYDAADTATISLSGSAVTQWTDKSANAYKLTQGNSGRQPTSGVNTLNSKNVITFDGNDVLLAATASNWTFMHSSTNCTIFYVAYFDLYFVENYNQLDLDNHFVNLIMVLSFFDIA